MKRILVVDDEPVLRDVFAHVLREEGYVVGEAGDGAAALAAAGAERPDLVLMDVMMPGMDGRVALRAMRSRPDLRAVPVVLMSAGLTRTELELAGAEFLTKPFDLDDMLTLVGRLIGPA